MGRAPCCSKVGLHRGPWTPREDTLLTKYIQAHGEGHWRSLPKKAGLLRCGKSCRLRWMNYLRPDIKRGNITPDEDDLIIRLHTLLGNRWSLIAGRLPGRTDNEIKNYWNTHISKRLRRQGTDPNTHKKLSVFDDLPVKETIINKGKNSNKKQNSTANKISKAKLAPPDPADQKPKVHLPKAIRVSNCFSMPRNDSFDLSSSHGGGLGNSNSTDHVVEVPWCNVNNDDDQAAGFLIAGGDHLVINGSDFECQSQLPTTDDHSLKKLYEEYLELLKTDEVDQVQLDSFAESLLI